jgi:hypothetical protein
VVIWELTGAGAKRRRTALRLIGLAFVALAVYLLAQSVVALASGHRAAPSAAGVLWTAVTAAVMFALAAGKHRTGRALRNEVLLAEGRVTLIDGLLACAVLVGLALDLLLGWWWADPLAGLVLVGYAVREAVGIPRADQAGAGEHAEAEQPATREREAEAMRARADAERAEPQAAQAQVQAQRLAHASGDKPSEAERARADLDGRLRRADELDPKVDTERDR